MLIKRIIRSFMETRERMCASYSDRIRGMKIFLIFSVTQTRKGDNEIWYITDSLDIDDIESYNWCNNCCRRYLFTSLFRYLPKSIVFFSCPVSKTLLLLWYQISYETIKKYYIIALYNNRIQIWKWPESIVREVILIRVLDSSTSFRIRYLKTEPLNKSINIPYLILFVRETWNTNSVFVVICCSAATVQVFLILRDDT